MLRSWEVVAFILKADIILNSKKKFGGTFETNLTVTNLIVALVSECSSLDAWRECTAC